MTDTHDPPRDFVDDLRAKLDLLYAMDAYSRHPQAPWSMEFLRSIGRDGEAR